MQETLSAQPESPATASIQLPVVQSDSAGTTEIIEVPDEQVFTPEPEPLYLNPTLLAAGIALLGTFAVLWTNSWFQKKRLELEERLADKKYEHDTNLEEKKFAQAISLATWQRKSEFAEQQLTLFYEVHARMKGARSPVSYSTENNDRQGRDEETEALRNARDSYYPVLSRIQKSSDFFTEFYAGRYRAVALFGQVAEAPYIKFWQAINRVQVSAQMLMRPEYHRDHADLAENRIRMEGRIWEGADENDTIGAEMAEAIVDAEELFRPIIVEAAPAIPV